MIETDLEADSNHLLLLKPTTSPKTYNQSWS